MAAVMRLPFDENRCSRSRVVIKRMFDEVPRLAVPQPAAKAIPLAEKVIYLS